jgi:hypothetical protein
MQPGGAAFRWTGRPVPRSSPACLLGDLRFADLLARSGKASIYKKTRPRPEASEGETQLAYLLLDGDSDLSTTDDQVLTGAGPSRADPHDLGPVHHYVNIEPWRSIFDSDRAEHIVPYDGSCADAGGQGPHE